MTDAERKINRIGIILTDNGVDGRAVFSVTQLDGGMEGPAGLVSAHILALLVELYGKAGSGFPIGDFGRELLEYHLAPGVNPGDIPPAG